MTIFDPKIYSLHRQRTIKSFDKHSFLFNHIGNELISRLEDIKRNFTTLLNLSPHSLSCPNGPVLGAFTDHSEEFSFLEGSFDLVVSCLYGHWVNDFPGLLRGIYRSLQPEGLFLGALWGGHTLFELRESFLQAELALRGGATPRIAPMLHPADAPHLLGKAGFFMPVVDTDILTVTYPTLTSLMKDLRGMGEANKLTDRSKTFTCRRFFEKTEEIYREKFGTSDHAFPATFEVIYLTGWKGR